MLCPGNTLLLAEIAPRRRLVLCRNTVDELDLSLSPEKQHLVRSGLRVDRDGYGRVRLECLHLGRVMRETITISSPVQ